MEYRHTQKGTVIIISLVFGIVLTILISISSIGQIHALPIPILLMVDVILFVSLALFYSLTVELKAATLICYFGIGLIRKSILLSEIQNVQSVKNPWYVGWGIRWMPGQYWLWNISGFSAVELTLKNGSRIRLGTDEPEKLVQAILSMKAID